MFEVTAVQNVSKPELYRQLAAQARHLVAGEPDKIANFSNISALLNLHLQDINWVGFYFWQEQTNELVLGPFQGKPACIRIGMDKGVCGTAAAKRQTIVVQDVLAFSGHIACDADSRSEIVVPLLRGQELVGVLDIDSPRTHRFDEADRRGLEAVVEAFLSAMRI